jgi:hypothetical protein
MSYSGPQGRIQPKSVIWLFTSSLVSTATGKPALDSNPTCNSAGKLKGMRTSVQHSKRAWKRKRKRTTQISALGSSFHYFQIATTGLLLPDPDLHTA